jgi:hypothetical protein
MHREARDIEPDAVPVCFCLDHRAISTRFDNRKLSSIDEIHSSSKKLLRSHECTRVDKRSFIAISRPLSVAALIRAALKPRARNGLADVRV